MPTPFICQECIARIANSTSSLPRARQFLLPAQASSVARAFHAAIVSQSEHEGPNPSRSHSDAVLGAGSSSAESAPLPSLNSSQRSNAIRENSKPWNGNITKVFVSRSSNAIRENPILPWNGNITKLFVSRSTPTKKRMVEPQAVDHARQLKQKILGGQMNFLRIHRDLRNIYQLSSQEARHAVGQLNRLLTGNLDTNSAARLLDQYLDWKKGFSTALRNTVALSSVQWDIPSMSDAVPEEPAPMKTAWQRLDQRRREQRWPQMVLSAVESEPHILPTFMQSTFDPSWCPSYIVEDLFYLLHRRLQVTPPRPAFEGPDPLLPGIGALGTFIFKNCPPRYLAMEQTVVLLIASSLPLSEISGLYELLKSIEHPIHANTLLQFASRFAKSFDTKLQAVDVIQTLTDLPDFDLNAPSGASVCTSLLTLNENEPLPPEQAAPDHLFQFLLERGFRPNLLELSALMRNFSIRGHLDTAWGIFVHMIQHGLEPDEYVYSILLNGAKRSADNAVTEKICSIITSRNAWSPILVNDFLDQLYRENELQEEGRRRQRKKLNNSWRPMLQLYAKFYDLAPLQRITLFSLENLLESWSVRSQFATSSLMLAESLEPLPADKLMKPDSLTLCLMMGAHMRSIISPKHAIRYFARISTLVKRKDPTVLGLLADRGTFVHDILLRTLMQFRQTVGFAIDQLRRMIDAAAWEKETFGRNLHYHRPSNFTWTIILNGLKNHGDELGAVSIFNMMSTIGHVKPPLPTYNILIQIFAKTRNVDAAVKAVELLEKAGFQPDDRTFNAFSKFPRLLRDQAVAKLESMRRARDRAAAHNSAAKSGESRDEEPYVFSLDSWRYSGPYIPQTLEELVQIQERWNIRQIATSSKKQRKLEKLRKVTIPSPKRRP